jgi:acyl-CoA dehydrogenase
VGYAADRPAQIDGRISFTRDYAVEGIYQEARMMRIVEGTSEIQRLLIARGVLEGYRAL